MKRIVRLTTLLLFPILAAELSFPQTQPTQKATNSQKPKGEAWSLADPMQQLRPEQERLIDTSFASYNATTGSTLSPNRLMTTLDCRSAPRSTR